MDCKDKEMIKRLYDLSDDEIFEAEKLHRRSPFSICKAAKIVKGRRSTGFKPKHA